MFIKNKLNLFEGFHSGRKPTFLQFFIDTKSILPSTFSLKLQTQTQEQQHQFKIKLHDIPNLQYYKKKEKKRSREKKRELPMVVIGETNSSCFILNKIEVFPAPSSPKATTLISILGPMCTLLSFVKATGMAASVSHRLAILVNCSCCSCTVSKRLRMLFLASIT